MLTATGSGYSRWNGLGISRWKADPTEDRWGTFIFLRDTTTGEWWSATTEPRVAEGEKTKVVFSDDKAEFHKTTGDLTSTVECIVATEHDAEGRLLIGGHDVETLVHRAGGTPLFVYDGERIALQVKRFRAAFPDVALHYAVKANPYAPLLENMSVLVDGFDVASAGELGKVAYLGLPISFAGPGKRDQEALDRDRARLPLAGSYRIVVLGCTRGAGQTVTAMMTGHVLAVARGIPVAALDLTPGPASLAARRPPAVSVQALLAGQEAEQHAARVDVVADDGEDFPRLADMLAERYTLTMIDPAPTGLTRVLARADQLVLVAPASPDAATSLANTQQWLGAHGYGELATRAVTVVNGVSKRTKDDVVRAESVVRGRCRAIVRVPWDDLLSSRPGPDQAGLDQASPDQQPTLQPQTRLAYTALAGVLVKSLAASHVEPSREGT